MYYHLISGNNVYARIVSVNDRVKSGIGKDKTGIRGKGNGDSVHNTASKRVIIWGPLSIVYGKIGRTAYGWRTGIPACCRSGYG